MLRIGSLEIAPPVALAPMAGVTDLVFRGLAKEQGCGLVCTEMISARALVHGNARTLELLRWDEAQRPVGVQLFGADPAVMAEAAVRVQALGADLVDVNMGCPVARIVGNGEGAALLRDPQRAASVVRAMAGAVDIPVTAKLRRGWSVGEETAPELAERLEDAGAAGLTIHGRYRSQGYSGQADWGVIRRVVRRVDIPVLGNGDVRTPTDARRMLEETGCAGVAVGRAALGDPWIFRRIANLLERGEPGPEPTWEERLAMAARHARLLTAAVGEEHAVPRMRKHVAWYLRGRPGAAQLRRRAFEARTLAELEEALRRAGEPQATGAEG